MGWPTSKGAVGETSRRWVDHVARGSGGSPLCRSRGRARRLLLEEVNVGLVQALNVVNFVANPTLTSVTATGTDDSASRTYKIVGVDSAGAETAASAGVTDAHGKTTLDASNYETLVWTDPPGAVSIKIYRTAGGGTQGLIGTVDAGVQTFRDTGIAGDGSTPSASNGTGIGSPASGVLNLSDLVFVVDTVGGGCTMQFQGSANGVDWINDGSAQNSSGAAVAAAHKWQLVRVKMTAYTSGTPRASFLAAQDPT